MTLRIATFNREPAEFAALAVWTGRTAADLRADDGLRDGAPLLAWDGDAVVGLAHPWRGPDGRLRLPFGKTRPDAYAEIAAAVPGECWAQVAAVDDDARQALCAAGFVPVRRDDDYEIPVAVPRAEPPPGITIVSGAETEIGPLARLDAELRDDVPGTGDWQVDLDWFREETYDSPFYDPLIYRVARDPAGRYVGLARIWLGPRPLPRLGLVGVLPGHRRRGLGRALVAAALAPLAERGARVVTAEVDDSNTASVALLTGLGGRVVGGTLELHRP